MGPRDKAPLRQTRWRRARREETTLNETASGCAPALRGFFLARLWDATAGLGSRSKGFLPRAALGCGDVLAGDHGRAYRGLHALAKAAVSELAAMRRRTRPASAGRPPNPLLAAGAPTSSGNNASDVGDAAAHLALIR